MKICDFGVCYVQYSDQIVSKQILNLFGLSPRYASPEALSKFHSKDFVGNLLDYQMSDAYSFATTVWELLHREVPWDGVNVDSMKAKVINGYRPPIQINESNKLSKSEEKMQGFLMDIIQDGWNQNPKMRPNFTQIIMKLNSIMF